jgi:hypothetical protein
VLKSAEEVSRVLTRNGANAFGILNKRWAFDHEFDGTIDWTNPSQEDPPERPTGLWLKQFYEWASNKKQCFSIRKL